MELLRLSQPWHSIEDGDEEPITCNIEKAFLYPSAESVSRSQRPVWDISPPRRHEEQEGEDDYAWYYKHPERYIRRPRRRRRQIKSSQQKNERFKVFDVLLNFSRNSWSDTSVSETQDSTLSETWSLFSPSIGSCKHLRR